MTDAEVVDATRAALVRYYRRIDEQMTRTPVRMTDQEIRDVFRGRLECLFDVFLRPVPDGAEFPCVWSAGDSYTIHTGEFGYRIEFAPAQGPCVRAVYPYFHGEPRDAYPVHVGAHGYIRCDNDSHVMPWLRGLVREFGIAMVFRAHLVACQYALRVECALPAPACGLAFQVRGARFVHVSAADGVSVPVGADAIGPVARPDQLSPWTRAFLARPDAHAILAGIVEASCHS